MAIQVSPLVNNMLFVLIGERLMQANEDLARDSHAAFRGLAHDVRGLSDVIERTVSGTARALPPQVGNDYLRAMGMFVDTGGTGYLRQFAGQLDDIADGRVKTSYDIMEGKWQISAEVIRLLIELKTLLWLSAVTGGATAGRAVVAQQRSRVAVLLILHQLLSKTHLLPVLSEAFEEAFQSFAVRLGMIAFTSGEQSFNGFDWGQIGQDAVFGGLAGGFFGRIAGGNEKFLALFRDDVRRGAFAKSVADDVTVKVGAEPGTGHVNQGSGVARQPHASSVFLASGGSEALAEILGSGLFHGNWATSWDTFLGAGVSGNVGEGLNKGAEKTGLAINLAFNKGFSSEVPSWPADAQNAGVNTVGTDEGDGGGGAVGGGGEAAVGGTGVTGATGSEAAGVAGTAGAAGVTGAAVAGAGVVSGRAPTVSGADAGVSDAGVVQDQGAVRSAGVPSAGSPGSAESGGARPRPAGEVGTGSAAGGVTEVAAQALPAVGSSGTGVSAVAGRPAEVAAVGEGRAPAAEVTAGLEPAEPVQVVAGAVSGGAGSAAMGASTAAVQAAGPVADPGRVANQPVSSAGRPSTVSEPAGDTGRARIGERSEQAGARPSGQVNPSARSGAADGSGDVVAADVVQQAGTDERTMPEAVDAARRPGHGVLSLGDGRVENSSTQAGGAGTVPSAGPGVLSGGSSGPGRLLGSGEVRTDRFVPGSGEAFVVEVGGDGLPGRVLPGGSGEWTEVGFVWEWYAGDRPGQETIRLTRRIFLDDRGVDAGRVEVMRRNAFAGLAELNARGGRLPAVQPGGLDDGSDSSGPRLELAVEFVDSEADAHDVVQVRDGRPQAPGDMVQNVWFTQASPVLLAHEIAHGYGPRDAQAHDGGARDGGRALLTSPRDERGRPLGVPLTSHGDEAQQAGEGSWDLMGPIDVGESGRSYELTPHELGQIADILSPFLHHGVSAPKPRVVQETAYARPAAPVRSDEGLGFEDGLGFDVDMESGDFGDFAVFPGDDGEAVGSRAWAGGSVDEDADVFALAEEYSGPAVPLVARGDASASVGVDGGVEASRTSRTEFAESGFVAGGGKRLGGSESSVDEDDTDRRAQRGSKRRRIEVEAGTGGGEGVRDEGADSDPEDLNTASVSLTELLPDFGSQSVWAGEPADVDMEGAEEFAGSAGSVGLSSAGGEDASGAVGASDPGGAGSDARRELEKAVDDLKVKLGSLDALFQEIGAESDDVKKAIREEEWDSVSPEVLDAIYEKREEYRDAPRFAVRVQVAREQLKWLQKEKKKFPYIANKVGAKSQEVNDFRHEKRVLPVATLKEIAGLYAAERGPELQVQELDSQRSFPGGDGSDVRRLEEAVDDLTSKLGSLDALLREIGADPTKKKAIRDEKWHLVSREVVDAIHGLRREYRDAPRFAVGVKAARHQLKLLRKERTFSYIASRVGADRKQVEDFSYGQYFLRAAVLMKIADLYARERGLELPGQRLHSQRSSSEEIPAELSEFLDEVRLDELEDPPAAGSADTVTAALLGSDFGSQFVSAGEPADVDMEGAEEFAGSAGSVGLSSAAGGDASGAVGASDPGGADGDAWRGLEEAVDVLMPKLGSLDALFEEIGAESDDVKKAIREEEWNLVSPEVLDAIHEKREKYRDAPRYAVRVKDARKQLEWLQDEKEMTLSYIANNVGATRQEVSDFRKQNRVLPFATLMKIAGLYVRERGPELQVQQLDSQRSSPGGSGGDVWRELEEVVDDLKVKLGSLGALFEEIGAESDDVKKAIREEEWDSVSPEVLDAIHEKQEEYRDAPRFAVRVKVARNQVEWLQNEAGFSYIAIAEEAGLTKNRVHKFRTGRHFLPAAVLMKIADLYARERERELQVQRLHSQRSSSEEIPTELSEFLDEVRLDELEDPPAAGSADRVTAALLGFEDGLGFDVDVESGGFGDFGVSLGGDGEAVGSRARAVGSVDGDADVFALAEEYSGSAVRLGARDVASVADGVDDGVEASRTSRTEFTESGLVAGGGKRLGGSEFSVDEDDTDRSAQHWRKRRRIEWLDGLGAADAVDDVLGGLDGIDLSSAWGMVPGAEPEVPFPGAVETGRARIEPVPLDREDAPQWVGEPDGGCLSIRHFEARRYLLPSGEFSSVAVVRLFLDQKPGQQIPGEALTELGQRAQQGVDERWNTGHRLPNGDLFRVELEFVTERDSVHHVVTVHSGNPRADHMNWGTDTQPEVLAHEVGHLLGLEDEYREGDRNRQRAVYEDEGLMGPFARDGRGRPAVDNDHAAVVDLGRMRIAPRYLRQLGAWIEGALKTARLQTAHGVAFSTEDTLYPRADGLPTRAHFALDVRRSVLYGEARTGGGGRITPAPASDHPRPVALEGTDRPNGTYRATYPDLHRRPVRENLTDLIAGDLLLPAHPDPGPDPGLMMFPAHWTEEDAVYAAEQAYLHALRNGTVQPVPGWYGAHTWRGEYAGVWIEGEVRQGVFTGFRPSDDQADTLPPPHAAPPAPAADNHGGPVFGRRVEDLVRYGDRRTRTGAHHEPGLTPADQMRFHGLQINHGQEHHNKTYDAQVFFLHPGLRVGESRPFLPRAWEQHVDGDKHVMFPREWKPDTLLDNVEKAHGSALDAGTVRQVDDRGTYHWVGTAAGVRIEGLVRDGRHLVFRPTYVQAHVSWPEFRPVGEVLVPSVTAASDDGRVLPFDIRHLLFANGQRAVELTVRIHLAPAPGTDLAWMDETFDKVRQAMRGAIMRAANVSPMNGALVGLTLLRTDDVEQAHHTLLVVGRDERLMIGGIVGFLPNRAELRTFVEQLVYGWAPPADAWRLPADADQDDGSWALSHAVERLAFADPFGRPTTLREPDPSARGDWPSNVPSDAPSAPPADFDDLDETEIYILSPDGFALAEEYSGSAVRLGARDVASVADGVDDGVEASRTSQTVLPGGLSGRGRLLGSGEVRTDRFVPGSGEAFVVEVGGDGLPGRVLPGGSGEWTEVGFVWEWYAGDRPGQETIRLTRRIFLDDRGVDAGRVEVMRRNAFAGLAELNARGGRLPAVQPGGLDDGSDSSGPRLELAVEFVDSEADAHDVVQVRDGRPQAPGDMVQNVWFTQASPVLLAHEIAHGYGPRDAQAHDGGARDGGRALLTSPRDERGRPLGVPLTSHGDEAQQAGEGSWDLMGPIDVGESGRSYELTPHELGQIADILSPFLHHGVSAPKPRVVQETAYARPAAPVRSDEGLGFEDGLGFDVDMESGDFGDFAVFPGDDGEAVGSRAWAGGSVDEDADVFALAEEFGGEGVRDEGADSDPEDLNTASVSLTELLPDFGSQSVWAGEPADVDMEGAEEFAGSAGSVGLSSAGGEDASGAVGASDPGGAGSDARRELEKAIDDLTSKLGSLDALLQEIGADPQDEKAIREEEWDSVSPEVLDAIYEKREEYRDAPRFAVRVQIARQQMVWLQREKNRGSSYIANKVGATKHEVHNFRYHQRFLSLAVLKRIAGLYVAEGGPEVQVQQLDSQRSFPGGGGSDVRRLEEAVDDLTSKLGTLAALFKEIDADSDDDKKAIQDEEWHLVSPEVLGAIHEKREEYRDAPRYAVRVKVAQEQVAWLNREYPYSYIAGKVRATKDQLRHFKHGETFLPLAVLKRIADLYARERGLKLPGQRLHSQRSSSEEIPAELSEFLDEVRLDELEDGSADGVTAALLGFEDGLGFDVDVESGGFEDFAPDAAPAVNMSMVEKRDRPYVRPSEPGERLFRFDDRPPEEIYKVGGFHPRAPENLTQIWDWAKFTNSPSQFVSTTRNPKLWFKGKRYRYEIDTSLMEDSCGIDINITMAKEKDGKRLPKSWRNHYPHEREVAFTGSIPAEAVVSVYDGHEEREGTWPPASGEVEWPANGEEQQDAMLPSPDQLGQPGGGPEPTGVPYVTESAPPAPVGFVPAGADESEASSDPSGLSGTSSADGSDGNEMASPGAMPALSHEQADGPMVTAGNPAGLDPESGAAGANPDDDESSAMADLQSAMVTAIAQEEDDGAWPGRPAPGRPELGKNVALAVGLPTGGEDSSGQAGGAGVPSVGPGVLPGDSSGLGELLGSGEVRTDRWLPYGVNPGRSDEERSGSNRRRDGERPVEPFEFIVAPDGRRRVQRPDGRRGRSGERTEVGYDWEWYAGDRPGQETIRLTRRLFLEDQNADPARVAAMRLRLAAFMEQVNREGNRLKVLQPDQVTGPQLPGPRVQFAVEFVGSKDRAHQEVQVRDGLPGGARDMVQNRWYTDVHPAAHFHEVFHGYGPRDDDASEKVLLTPGGRSTQVLSAGESSLMGKFENLQSRIVITSDHLQQIADILTPYLPYGVRAFTDRVPADGAAGGEADAVVVRPAAEPATESVALSDGASPGETQEAPVSGDTAPSVDYRMVHEPDRDHVVESSVTASETTADQSVHTTERQPRPTMGARAGDQQSMAPSDGGLDHEPTEPGEDSAGVPDAGQQRIVFARIETALEVHRPPRIDHSMPSPSLEGGPVRFDDDSRLPEYLTGDGADDTKGRSYGHSQVTLRGADLALQEISEIVSTHLGGEASTVPGLSEVLADLSQAMRTVPQRFHGDGYQSSAFGNSPIRVLRVVTRPYGNWERFTDLHGEPAKLEVAQRSQVTAGAVQSVGTGRRAARGVSVLPAPGAAAFARLGVTAGSTRTAEYGMQDETVSQVETRTAEASHLHLDDVAYEVSLSGAPETVSSGGRPAGSSTTGETFTFAVRNGLAVRLADSETLAADPGRVPDRMELDERSDYRLVHTEGYGPVRGLAEQLVDGFGAVPGSAAYEYITEFLTSENFHRAADRLAKGNVPSDPLFAEDGSPLGAFVVEKVVPGEAELLTESRAAEMRHTIQQTATNERTLSTTSSRGVNLTLGPSSGLGPLGSLMAGPSVGYDRSSTHSSTFGGSGGRKIVGRAKNVPTVLYKVQKTVHVRRTGGEVITFDTWSLDRMTHTEARRLAGWDDGTTLRKREPANEPYAPAYLTKDRPAVLGMSRPEAFLYDSDLVKDEDQQKSWLQAFTDRVIGSAAKTYPDLLAPLEDFGDPNHSRWRDREHYNLALRNTLRVMNALSHHRMAGSLEELMTGLVIELDVVPGIVMRPRLSIRIRGVLTGRRYEGTQNDLILRHSAPGTERLDGSQSTTHTRELGTDVSLWGFADTANVSGGYTRRGQNGRGTQYGATASQEQLAISSLPSHLHSYRLELTAEIGGFWRYRSGPRALTLGWLGRQHYLQDEGSTDLVGGSADEFVGRVVLAVPDEYTPATDPDVAESAVAIEAVELDPAHTRALATRNAAVVSEGHGPDVFGDQPHQTLGVGTDERLMGVAVDLMRTASGASWHFSRPGALPHDAIVRFLQPQLLTGGFDQRSGPVGSRISVIAKGHWRDRVGELVHRMRILNLRVASGPIKLETETGVSSDLRMAESVTAATSSGWTLSGGGTTGGTELSTIVGVQYRRGSSRTESTKVTRTVTSDINRDDSGYKILLSGDVQHDIVASVRPEGFLGPYRDRFNGKQLTFPSSYLGQVPEKAAHQLGILKDGLGDVPRYVSHQWAQTTWWHDHPFGSYPVNSLDTSKVLAAFDEQLQRWNVDEADRERVHSLVTPRAVRALREQMTSTGAAARTRVGRWRTPFIRIGSRAGSLRVELIAGESEFVGLDHGVVMEDTRIATVTRTDGGSSVRSRGMGLTAMQQVATVAPGSEPGLGGPESLRPQFGVQTTSSDLTSHGRSRARTKRHIFYAREPHADYRTPYTLRLTLDLGRDKPTLTEEGPVGTLREQVPLSLSVARIGQTDDVLGPPSLDDPSGSVVLWPQDGAVLRHIAAWRSARQPHGAQGPIQLPSSGFHVRRIVGLETLREAGVLAIATAYGSSVAPAGSPLTLTGKDLADALEEARSTGLTRPGTGSALALDNATGDAALAAFFEDSATAAGYEVPGLNEGGSTGDYRLYSGPDFTRATLLAVIPVSTMESAERHSAGRAGAEEHTSGFEYSLGGRAAFAANDAGSVAPSASMAGPSTAEAGGQVIAGQESAQFNTKVAGRSFVFAIPTDWLGVAEVTRSSPFGPITSRPQAVETQGKIIALVHEDVARELGLINDENFPSRVADAWTQVVKAGQAWTDADSAYWEQRRALADLQGEERKRKRASMKDLPRRAKTQAAMNHLLQQADAAAKEFHRVRAAADRLTRWHQLPAEAHQAGESELRAGQAEPPAVVFQPVPVAETDSADAERYIVRESTPDGPGRLISPGGDHYTVHDVPTDGDAFFHALAEAVHHAAPDRLTARVDVADRQKIIDGLRRLLADELSNPGARGLLKFTSPDTKDTFSASDLAASGVDFREGSPERREYEDSGHIPLHAELPAEQRQRLARTQLLRRGDTEEDAGWNHGAADLQPSLAARVFNARITVVRADGAFQDFRPLDTVGEGTDEELVHRVPDEELVHMVLLSKDGHYLPALPSDDLRREPPLPAPAERDTIAAALQTGTPSGQGLRPAYSTPPWERGATSTWRAVVTNGKPATLVDPDGTVHELREPPGDGNGIWSGIADALELVGATASAAEVRQQSIPTFLRLDREWPFTDEELVRAGLSENGILTARLRRADGRIPADFELTKSQEEALIRQQVFTPRRWDDVTERNAAELAAARGLTLTVVAEDGTSRTHAPGDGTSGPRVILWRRGRDYLRAERPMPDPKLVDLLNEPAFVETRVRREHLEAVGLSFSPEEATMWLLAPEIMLQEFQLSVENREALLRAHPDDLFPASVRDAYKRLGSGENA